MLDISKALDWRNRELSLNIFITKIWKKSNAKIDVYQSCQRILPLVVVRELKFLETKEHE